jgi:hypothetical protein
MFFRPKLKDADPKERALWGDLLAMGMVFPIAIALGYFIGRWAGGKLGYPTAGILVGLAWGAATGFWELYKVTKRMERLDQPPEKKPDDHEPPHDPQP